SRRLVAGPGLAGRSAGRRDLRDPPLPAGVVHRSGLSVVGGGDCPTGVGHRHRHRQLVEDCRGLPGPRRRNDPAGLDAARRRLPGAGRSRAPGRTLAGGAIRTGSSLQGDLRVKPDETVIRLSEVRMEGVGKRYGSAWAVKDVSLSVRPGEFYTLLG